MGQTSELTEKNGFTPFGGGVLILLINCLKGHICLRQLCKCPKEAEIKKLLTEWLTQSVPMSLIELSLAAKIGCSFMSLKMFGVSQMVEVYVESHIFLKFVCQTWQHQLADHLTLDFYHQALCLPFWYWCWSHIWRPRPWAGPQTSGIHTHGQSDKLK